MRRVVAGVCHCREKRVPSDVGDVDVEHSQVLRHNGEVDHLQQRPHGAVRRVRRHELVAHLLPALLHGGAGEKAHAVEEVGGVAVGWGA